MLVFAERAREGGTPEFAPAFPSVSQLRVFIVLPLQSVQRYVAALCSRVESRSCVPGCLPFCSLGDLAYDSSIFVESTFQRCEEKLKTQPGPGFHTAVPFLSSLAVIVQFVVSGGNDNELGQFCII